ncbi:hypothetical protein D621_13135 [beta proteobacterium AAP51]|nr:hypothetical protein D621_13135 [beta proteobacterium AAP51]
MRPQRETLGNAVDQLPGAGGGVHATFVTQVPAPAELLAHGDDGLAHVAITLAQAHLVDAQAAHQGVGGRLAFAGQQGHGGALQQRGVVAAQAIGSTAQHQPRELFRIAELGLGEQAHARREHIAGDGHAHALVDVGAQRQHVQPRVAVRAAEGQQAAFDLQLLAIGRVGAAFGADGAVDGQPAARRGQPQLAAQAGVEPAPAHAQALAEVDVHAQREVAARGRGFGGVARRLGRVAAAHGDVVVQRRRVAAAHVEQALVDAELAVELQALVLHRRFGLAAGDDEAVHAAQHAQAIGLQLQLAAHDGEPGAQRGTAGDGGRAVAGAQRETLDLRLVAGQLHQHLAFADAHALQQVAHGQPLALQLPVVERFAEGAAELGGAFQRAGQAPARGHPGAPDAEVGHAGAHLAGQRGFGVRPAAFGRGLCRHAAREFAHAAAPQQWREVPHPFVRRDGEAEVGQPHQLHAVGAGQVQVAVGAFEHQLGVHLFGGADVHARSEFQVALPAHVRLQARQQRRQREGLDGGAQLQLGLGAAQVDAHVVPAQREGVAQAQAAGAGLQGLQVALGTEVEFGAQVAGFGPGGFGSRADRGGPRGPRR